MAKLKIAVLYGGKSNEHEVSVHSAQTVCEVLEKKYEVIKIFISKTGSWHLQTKVGFLTPQDKEVSPLISDKANLSVKDGEQIKADIFFPVLHGALGEDGAMQGFFEVLNVPYVGCGVLTSAAGMDKELSKLLASFYGVPIVPYIKLDADIPYKTEDVQAAVVKLGYPLFVKPIASGSSVGVTKVNAPHELVSAINKAFTYGRAVLIEKAVDRAREIFCGVIGGGQNVHSSFCGELKAVNSEFFDYKAKYEDPHGCDISVPAAIPQEIQDKMRHDSRVVFQVLRGEGLARVDFLLGSDGKYYFSEINTLPGLSAHSLFPQLWNASKKEFEDVLDILIHLGLKRAEVNSRFSLER